jgi:hypothetical protein
MNAAQESEQLMETAADAAERLHDLGLTDERGRAMFLALAIRLANRAGLP